MKKYILSAVGIVLAGLMAVGCGKEMPKPVEVVVDVDKCEICNMMIGDEAFATEIILKGGKVLKFDDIGCMYDWEKKNGTEQIEVAYVHDHASKEWIDAKDAAFVYDKTLQTPMAYGVYSFKNKSDAEALIAQHQTGKLLTAQELVAHDWERNMDMMKNMHMNNNHGDGAGKNMQMDNNHGDGAGKDMQMDNNHGDAGKGMHMDANNEQPTQQAQH